MKRRLIGIAMLFVSLPVFLRVAWHNELRANREGYIVPGQYTQG